MNIRDMKIKTKITFIVISGIVASVGVVGGYSLFKTVSQANRDIATYKTELMGETRQKLKDLVDASYTMLDKTWQESATAEAIKKQYGTNLKSLVDIPFAIMKKEYDNAAKGGALPESAMGQIRSRITNDIAGIRYGDGGYFWINDTRGIMVMHPIIPELNGKDMGSFTKNGKVILAEGTETPIFSEMVRVCMNSASGDGFVSYFWPDANDSNRLVRKLSYVRLFKPLNWIIGTGITVDKAESDGQARFKEIISGMRYGKDDYFYVVDTNYTIVTHPNKDLIGKNMKDSKDPNGKFFIREQVDEAVSKGEAYVDFYFQKLGSEKPVPKISYVRYFKNWNWIVASGVYIDELENQINTKEKNLRSSMWSQVMVILITIGLFVVGAFYWVVVMSRDRKSVV
jgi:methyl-accepting chemotaxis protein